MFMSEIEMFMTAFMIVFLALYAFAFYTIILKRDIQKRFLRTFHNAVCSVYKEVNNSLLKHLDPKLLFEQLNLNYEKLCQTNPNTNYSSILDLLETIIYYYDSCSDIVFKKTFRQEKDPAVRNFIMEMCLYIKSINPFISAPQKEADLMQSITDALENNNKSLGLNSLKQLSQEVLTKEKLLDKKNKENQKATIVSVVGIVLTIFFGLLSIFPIIPKY